MIIFRREEASGKNRCEERVSEGKRDMEEEEEDKTECPNKNNDHAGNETKDQNEEDQGKAEERELRELRESQDGMECEEGMKHNKEEYLKITKHISDMGESEEEEDDDEEGSEMDNFMDPGYIFD